MSRFTLTKKNSTKAERILVEVFKELRISFKHRVIIEGREIDFLIKGNVCIEIDGHAQDFTKNEMLIQKGFVPLHLTNREITQNKLRLTIYVNQFI